MKGISLASVAKKKAVLQAEGVRVPPDLVAELEANYNAPSIRSGRMVLCLESPGGSGELVPAFIINGKFSHVLVIRIFVIHLVFILIHRICF